MSTRDFAIVGIRILAIYCLVLFLVQLSGLSYVPTIPEAGDRTSFYMLYGIPSITLLASGVLLLVFSESFATRIVPETTDGEPVSGDLQSFQSVLFSAVGLYLAISAVPSIFISVAQTVRWYHLDSSHYTDRTIEFQQVWLPLAGHLCQFLIGCFLFIGSRAVVSHWRKIQANRKS